MTTKIMKYSQFDFHDDINRVALQIKHSEEKFDYIVGLSRGGLIPGVVLSHKLSIPFLALNWSNTSKEINELVKNAVEDRRVKRILIVDDMVDTGNILKLLFQELDKQIDGGVDLTRFQVAVLINNTDVDKVYENQTGNIRANYYAKPISRNVTPDWIEYWWEA